MILVTGGAGYIGSHTCVELLNAGFDVVVFDNLCNSRPEALERVQRITGKQLRLIKGDCRDRAALSTALQDSGASSVIHFAGLKAVGESVKQPLAYYDNNVVGTLRLLEAMEDCGVRKLVFSSSATVYGDPKWLPLTEDHPLSATNPSGRSKLMVEEILRDLHRSDSSWHLVILRYFNPVGAHPSGLIGEDPLGIPDNLMPFVAQVAVGRREILNVWGNDYLTPEGTGTGYSVLDMVRAFEKASGRRVPYRIAPRRPGDIASCYADAKLARKLLGWQAERGLEEMCVDTWRWQSTNPEGYGGGGSRGDSATA